MVALCLPSGEERVAPGEMPGRVIRELRGTGGFGYDVLFVPDDQDGALTSAEMTAEAKDLISHRGHSLLAINVTTDVSEALGMPVEMFPVLFAIGRTSGWIAQWLEMIEDGEQKIARPRQIYTGARTRDYVPMEQRA